MIKITDKIKCTGCGACGAVCPCDAISFFEDDEGFRYPRVDEERCIGCGKCNSICPMMNNICRYIGDSTSNKPIFFAVQLKDKKQLLDVSSGGAFWALAEVMISNGGVVYGAFNSGLDNIKHGRAETLDEARMFRKSKYLQSDIREVYGDVRRDLEAGKMVLFSGTPCQVAGLIAYFGEKQPRLYTCEVVCHGVPSKAVFQKYILELEDELNKCVRSIDFRDKSKGWNFNQYRIDFDNGTTIYERSTNNKFHRGYLLGLYNRPSCSSCHFSSMPRVADLTLADYWKYNGENKDIINSMGVSLVVCNTEKGNLLFRQAENYLVYEATNQSHAIRSCRHLARHPYTSSYRVAFIKDVKKNGFKHACSKYYFLELIKLVFMKIYEKYT